MLVKVSGAFVARGLRSVYACSGDAVTKAISMSAAAAPALAPPSAPAPAPAVPPVAPVAAAPVAVQPAPVPPQPPAVPAPVAAPPPPPQLSLQQQAQLVSQLPGQPFLPLTLKNGCAVDSIFGSSVKELSLSRQELNPASCPANGRYTGFVSFGASWTFAPADGPEQSVIGVRHGYVLNGHFVGVQLSQNQQGVIFVQWRDLAGNFVSKRFERFPSTGAGYSLEAIRQTIQEGLNASVRPDERREFEPLFRLVGLFDANAGEEMRRFTSVEPYGRSFPNPNWVRPKDDPKVRGRSARGG
jgi:hypothetical protein